MRVLMLAAALIVFAHPGAQNCAWAADITVYSPNIVNGPLQKLADAWTAETGNKVTLAGFNVGKVRAAVDKDDPGDVVVAPTRDFTDFAPKLAHGVDLEVQFVKEIPLTKVGKQPMIDQRCPGVQLGAPSA